MQMDIAYDVDGVDFVCVPVEKCVKLISLQTGEVMNNLNGHFNAVNSCVYRPFYNEIFSAAKDRRLFVWTPRMDQTWGRPDDFDPSNARKFDEDNWGDL